MNEHKLNFSYTARYFQLGNLSKDTEHLIYVLHGYGQHAKYFLRKFIVLDNSKNCIIAPEGLSRFYLEGFSGRVGATWMTREDRLTDIDNYISYLNTIHSSISKNLRDSTKVSVLGFSQGAATASRWIAKSNFSIDQLVLWAGIFPPDLDYPNEKEKFRNLKLHYVYGLNDPYILKNRLNEMDEISKKLEVKPAVITFDGEHTINDEPLKKIFL